MAKFVEEGADLRRRRLGGEGGVESLLGEQITNKTTEIANLAVGQQRGLVGRRPRIVANKCNSRSLLVLLTIGVAPQTAGLYRQHTL